jgi:hypothetical protein
MNRKEASTSSLGSGKADPNTKIQPLTGGAINNLSSPANPWSHEQGFTLRRPNADFTVSRFLLLTASQQEGRRK